MFNRKAIKIIIYSLLASSLLIGCSSEKKSTETTTKAPQKVEQKTTDTQSHIKQTVENTKQQVKQATSKQIDAAKQAVNNATDAANTGLVEAQEKITIYGPNGKDGTNNETQQSSNTQNN